MNRIGKYLSFEELCTCTQTYQKFSIQVDPYPKNPASLQVLGDLVEKILDPIIDHYGKDCFQLTYGFCSTDLKRFLALRDPITGEKNGVVSPNLDATSRR